MPVASASASPPLEPPGVTAGSCGLTVGPPMPPSVCQRIAKSGMFVRPRTIAPAARRCATAGASDGAIAPSRAATPSVVAVPATSMFSLTVTGTPCSGPSTAPDDRARSASSAAASASSASTTRTALSSPLRAAMRARCASTTSRLDACPSLIARARAPAPCSMRSMAANVRTPPGARIGRTPYSEKPALDGEQRRPRAGGDAGLGVDVLDVVADRLGRDAQPLGDLLVGQAAGDEAQDLDLALGQPARLRHPLRRALARGRAHRVGGLAVERAGARH